MFCFFIPAVSLSAWKYCSAQWYKTEMYIPKDLITLGMNYVLLPWMEEIMVKYRCSKVLA